MSKDSNHTMTANGFSQTNGFHNQTNNGTTLNCESSEGSSSDGGSEMRVEEILIPVPWGEIAVKATGNPNGHPVLAVHGWMDNAGTFDRLIPLLSNSFYVVAVDLPGHGLSSHLPLGVPYHFMDFIISLRRVTNYFKWTKFTWLGHSMGAALGALYASSFPSYVEHVIMLDLMKPLTDEDGSDYANKISVAVDQFLALEEKIQPIPPVHAYDECINRLMKGTGRTLNLKAAQALMTRGARNLGDDQWAFNRDLRLMGPSILRLSNEQCYVILSKMTSPTMAIKASNGPWFSSKQSCEEVLEIYRKNCTAFHYVEVDGDHFVHLNEPEKIAEQINQFLTDSKLND